MSNSRRFKRAIKPGKSRLLTRQQLEDWLAERVPPAPNLSMLDGYLAALVVSPNFMPPEEWLLPIVGEDVCWAVTGTPEAIARDSIFARYTEIGATLSGGPRRYAPVFMRTDDGEVLLEDFANGFYFGMRLAIDDWKPFISDRDIGMPLVAILGHCTTIAPEDALNEVKTPEAQAALAESWEVVPEVVDMFHEMLAGRRNIKII